MYTLIMPIESPDKEERKYKIRPNAIEFLEALSEVYELVIYSSRKFTVVHEVGDILDPKGTLFVQTLSRRSCYLTKSKKFLKDLKLIKNRNLKNMLILDYKPQSFSKSPENGVIMLHWNGDEFDDQLMGKKLNYLKAMAKEYSCSFKNDKLMNYSEIMKEVFGKELLPKNDEMSSKGDDMKDNKRKKKEWFPVKEKSLKKGKGRI